MAKIFISHAAVDKPLAEAFEDLIQSGVGFIHDDIFCSSVEGHRIPPGKDFKQYMKEELIGAEVVIALITPNYYSNAFCMCELGATWISTKEFIPILVDPVDFDDLQGTLAGTQSLRLKDSTSLSEVYDRLSTLSENPVPVAKWEIKKGNFQKNLGPILANLKKPQSVKRSELDSALREREEFKKTAMEQDEETEKLKKQLEEVSKLKDQK